MSDSLPERPDLDQLRRRAKELRDAAWEGDADALARVARHHPSQNPGPMSLAAAQLVIAREMGFASWPVLKAAIETRAAAGRQLSRFLAASIEGPVDRAADIVRADPSVAVGDLRGAAVIGDVESVRGMVADDPAVAVAIDEERGWPPLLYACYSRWHQIEPQRAGGMAEVVRVLLDAGASANTNDGGRTQFRSALKGSVEVNNPAVAEVLLAAGANPHMGQPLVEAVGRGDQRCLRLLLTHGARVAGTWALGAAVYHDDAAAASLLLDALPVDGNARADAATEVLPEAVANASLPLVDALLAAGADPDALNEDGVPALRLAVRSGKHDIAGRLQVAGGVVEPTGVDRFIGACLNADRDLAAQLLAARPGLANDLTDDDRAVIVDAAGSRPSAAVRLLLDMGFPADARRSGETPLHAAAYSGNAPVVRVLLEAGAEVDARDDRFEATPLAFATVGSREQAGRAGDWIGTVRLLVEAGASGTDVWVSEKPPSEEVMDLLRSYGIGREHQAEPRSDEAGEPGEAGSIGTASMRSETLADVARHLEAAYRERDLDLLGSLFHPEVHWTGVCTNRSEVLDWYRGLLGDGMQVAVESVEFDHDAVILGVAVGRTAEGARPAPLEHLYQVFTVDGAQVVDIRGYPDRATALGRS